MSQQTVRVFENPSSFAEGAAIRVWEILDEALAERSRASLALAGGVTPIPLYRELAQRWAGHPAWAKVDFFWSDERIVPPSHPASNYHAARRSMLDPLRIPENRVHRIFGEKEPMHAATAYEEELRRSFPTEPPRFDLILLGLGKDGHTASLFPHGTELEEGKRLALPTCSPAPPHDRLSLSLSVLCAARHVLFLVSGAEKRTILARVLASAPTPALPATMVHPAKGTLEWLVDRTAAGNPGTTSATGGNRGEKDA